jgi:hypothetical protein
MVAEKLYLGFPFVIGIPNALFPEEDVTRGAPRVWPTMVIISFFREPFLRWVGDKMLADESLKSASVCRAVQPLGTGFSVRRFSNKS